MKLYLLLTLITMTQASFIESTETTKPVSTKASQELAQQLVDAFRQKSSDSYAQLIPSLNDFNKLMKANSSIYGNHLAEAQKSFAVDYENTFVPAVKNSFDQLMADGIEKGIVWSEVSLLNWETVDQVKEQFVATPFSIMIASQGRVFKIEIQKAFYLNGKWKVSQFVKLV